MSFINDINVTISAGTASVDRTGFRPLVMGSDSAEITEIVAAELADLVAAGYATTDPEYLMAAAMFAQDTRPTDILVYRKEDDRGGYQELSSTTVTFVGETVPALTANTYDIDITIDGGALNQLSVTIAATDDWFTIAADIQAALRVATGSTETVVVSSGRIRVTSATTGGSSSVLIAAGTAGSGGGDLIAAITTQVSSMTVSIESAVVGGAQLYSEALAILLARITSANNFRSVCIDSRVLTDLADVGTWATSNTKIFFGGINNVLAGSGRNNNREAYLISDSQTEYPECRWCGQTIAKVPGSYTMKFQKPVGIVAAGYTLTQLETIRSLNTQAPTSQGGVIYVNEGLMTDGTYIDDMIARDWIEEEIEARVLELFLNNEKIPYDDTGIKRTEAVFREVLTEAGENGAIARAESEADQANSDDGEFQFKVVSPLRADISSSVAASRVLTITFSYISAGAQHEVTGTGVVTT